MHFVCECGPSNQFEALLLNRKRNCFVSLLAALGKCSSAKF